MLGLVLMSKRKFLKIIGQTHQRGIEHGYRLGFTLGQLEANNRHYASMFGIQPKPTPVPDTFLRAFGEEIK